MVVGINVRWCAAQCLAHYRPLVSVSSYGDETVIVSRSLEQGGELSGNKVNLAAHGRGEW